MQHSCNLAAELVLIILQRAHHVVVDHYVAINFSCYTDIICDFQRQ